MIKLQDLIPEARISTSDIELFKMARKVLQKIMIKNGGRPGKRHTTRIRGANQFSSSLKGKWTYAWEPFKRGAPGHGYIHVMGDEKLIKKVSRKIEAESKRAMLDVNFEHGVSSINQSAYWKVKSKFGYDSRQFKKVEKIFDKYRIKKNY